MTTEQLVVNYDQFMPQLLERRRQVFNEISPENRAQLVRAHIERWLAANRSRLNSEQVAVVTEGICFVSPEKYEEDRDMEKIHQEIEALVKRAEAVLSREDVMQIFSPRADYIPLVEDKPS